MNRRRFLSVGVAAVGAAALVRGEDAEQPKGAKKPKNSETDPAGACGAYCEACRLHARKTCAGCGTGAKVDCAVYSCCRGEQGLRFCTECDSFPCRKVKANGRLRPEWLDQQAGKGSARGGTVE
jgi:hypothetical protein